MKFLEPLLSITERRQLEMIDYLIEASRPVPSTTLCEKFSISDAVLRDTLRETREKFDGMNLIMHNGTVEMKLPIDQTLQDIYRQFLLQLDLVDLAMLVFHNPYLSDLELAEELHISPSTLYRRIRYINKVLKSYNVTFSTNPYQVTGLEKNVRNIFLRLFVEVFPPSLWPDFIDEEPFDQILDISLKWFDRPINAGIYHTIKLSLLINFIRFQQGFKLDIEEENALIILNRISADDRKKLKKIVEEQLNVEFKSEFITQFIGEIADTCQLFFREHLFDTLNRYPEFVAPQTYLLNLLEDLEQLLDIEIPNRSEILEALHMSAYSPFLKIGNKGISYEPSEYFCKNIKRLYPEAYELTYEGLETYTEMMSCSADHNPTIIEDLMMVLFTTWDGLTLQAAKELKTVKILIISRNSIWHARLIKDYIHVNFSNRIQTTLYKDFVIDTDKISEMDIDIVVTDFHIPPIEDKIICAVEDFPTSSDFANISKLIHHFIFNDEND